MARLNAKNNAETALAQAVSESDTVFVVEDAGTLPDAPFRLSIEDEIVEVSAVDGNALTVERAVEDTQAGSYDVGTAVENRLTAGMYNKLATVSELPEIPEVPEIPEYPEVNFDSYNKINHEFGHAGQLYYIKIGKIVYIQGEVGRGDPVSELGTLPRGYRPALEVRNNFIDSSSNGKLNVVTINILPSGRINFLIHTVSGDDFNGTVVVNMSFPAED